MEFLRDKRGFTLLEMMIVVALMAIVAAIAVPNVVSEMPRYRLNGAARQVMSELVAARMQAVSQNNQFKIDYLNNHSFTILDDDDSDGTADGGEAVTTKDIQTEYSDVAFAFSSTSLTLYTAGTVSTAATITLTNGSGSRTVTVTTAGRVSIS